ncbi:MAG: hypothetical protein EA397_19985 [Deltaproteobacteria bacterium]|nr:MAG: hypothetical protein EA397_19985 [Deltaproteobacteria bacterium]
MNAPRILSMTQALRTAPALVQRALRAGALRSGATQFVVTVGGDLNGLYVERGAVLVCDPDSTSSRCPVVLLPKGHGRPCVGRIEGKHLRGEHGEPCSPRRWQVSGGIVQVLQVGEGERLCAVTVPLLDLHPATPCHVDPAMGRWAELQPASQLYAAQSAVAPSLVSQPMLERDPAAAERAPQLSLFAWAA